MNDNRVGTLYLNDEESINFAESFYNPSDEEITRHNTIIDEINSTVSIIENDNGFTAEVDALDLGFLETKTSNDIVTVTVKVKIRTTNKIFNNNSNMEVTETIVNSAKKSGFTSCKTNNSINIAA